MLKSKRKTEHITLLVDKQLLKAIDAKCEEIGLTRSQYLRNLASKDLNGTNQ
jgi:antitoxin component of RelBE/YafQ-DinJ toxin-antitoxin module